MVWVNLSAWPDDVLGKKVKVSGFYQTQNDLPVFLRVPGEPIKAGIPVPPGTDLEKASARKVLDVKNWEVVKDP